MPDHGEADAPPPANRTGLAGGMSLVEISGLFTTQLALAGLAAIVGAAVRAYAGFGTNIIWAPVLALLFGPVEAITIMAIANLVASVPLCVSVARDVDWPEVSPILLGVLILSPIGVLFLISIDPTLVRRAIGGIVLAIGLILFTGWRYRGPRGKLVRLGVGGLAGWISGFSGVGGPIVVSYLMSGTGDARTQRANNMIIVASMAPIVLTVLLIHNTVAIETVFRTVILLVPYFFGQWAGIKLFNAIPERYFRGMVLALLIIVGTSALLL